MRTFRAVALGLLVVSATQTGCMTNAVWEWTDAPAQASRWREPESIARVVVHPASGVAQVSVRYVGDGVDRGEVAVEIATGVRGQRHLSVFPTETIELRRPTVEHVDEARALFEEGEVDLPPPRSCRVSGVGLFRASFPGPNRRITAHALAVWHAGRGTWSEPHLLDADYEPTRPAGRRPGRVAVAVLAFPITFAVDAIAIATSPIWLPLFLLHPAAWRGRYPI